MTAVTVSFRWLDILEKEFDKAFVDLQLIVGKSKFYVAHMLIRLSSLD